MLTVQLTTEFAARLDDLRDRKAQVRIVARLRQAEAGNLGDWKPVGTGVAEMRVNFGPGYRLYFARKGSVLVVMLAGGSKSSQAADIRRAQRILKQLESEL